MVALLNSSKANNPFRVDHSDPDAARCLGDALHEKFGRRPPTATTVVLCIGTDRSTGDALGPLVGEGLRQLAPDLHIFGTLEQPVHAVNLGETVDLIRGSVNDPYIVAIDACLGQLSSVGQITLGEGALRPGAGVHKKLPPVGDLHITGIVNVGGFMEYFVLQNTRLSVVFRMASVIASGLGDALSRSVLSSASVGTKQSKYGALRVGNLFRSR